MSKESTDDISRIAALLPKLTERHVASVVIGMAEDVAEFLKISVNAPELVIKRPIEAAAMANKIEDYLDDLNKNAQKYREREATYRMEISSDTVPIATKRRILVIDDDARMLRLLKERLHYEYEVAVAPSGKVARKYLASRKPDLILLDYEMPEENGPQVLISLREDMRTKDIPVVFLTGASRRAQIAEVLALQPQGYLLKPVDHFKLMETIEGIFQRKGEESS